MKLGILQCDRVRPPLAIDHGQYPDMFATLLQGVDPTLEIVIYDVEQGKLPAAVDEADAYLITGSRHGVYDGYAWITQLQEFIVTLADAEKKLIGICFGHQIIAQSLGGQVIKSPKGWGVGLSNNKILKHKPWMNSSLEQFDLIVSHQDQVVTLPPQAEVLAGSEFCPYFMLQIRDHFLTIQGHPEFPKAYALALLNSREDPLDEQHYQQACKSLASEANDQLIAQWIINFINS